MFKSISQLFRFITPLFKTRIGLQVENLALRHQLCVLQRSVKRSKIRPADRVYWSLLSRVWSDWQDALIFVKPETPSRPLACRIGRLSAYWLANRAVKSSIFHFLQRLAEHDLEVDCQLTEF